MSYLKGALVEFMPTALVPVPNVIVFQYNPETISHAWTQPEAPPSGPDGRPPNPWAVKGSPGESFTFTVSFDAADSIAAGGAGGDLALVSGVHSRLAALEMLLYPAKATTKGNLLGTVTAAIGAVGSALGLGGGSDTDREVPANTINPVFFVWGPYRIVPVRLTGLTVTERLYDALLSPTRAEAQITLRVLTDEELRTGQGWEFTVARVADTYAQTVRQALAVSNLVNAEGSILGMLPT